MVERREIVDNKEIEDFLGKIKKVHHGEISPLVLGKFADKKTLKLLRDKGNTRFYGECVPFDKINPPIIEITFLKKENFLFLTIVRNENDFSRQENASDCLLISGSGGEAKIESAIYKNRRENANFLDSYERYLAQINGYIASLIEEIESKKIQ
ncbi:hypothetical protein MUP35_03350 [Patescibacteria group bacterium]|nr:hypothetical protein [Patescibacteria group bacterium]